MKMLREKLVFFTLTIPKKKFESFLLTFCLTQLLIRIKLTKGDNGVYFSHDVKNIVPNLLVFSHIRVKIYILSCTYTDWKECYSYFFHYFFTWKRNWYHRSAFLLSHGINISIPNFFSESLKICRRRKDNFKLLWKKNRNKKIS